MNITPYTYFTKDEKVRTNLYLVKENIFHKNY